MQTESSNLKSQQSKASFRWKRSTNLKKSWCFRGTTSAKSHPKALGTKMTGTMSLDRISTRILIRTLVRRQVGMSTISCRWKSWTWIIWSTRMVLTCTDPWVSHKTGDIHRWVNMEIARLRPTMLIIHTAVKGPFIQHTTATFRPKHTQTTVPIRFPNETINHPFLFNRVNPPTNRQWPKSSWKNCHKNTTSTSNWFSKKKRPF